VFVEAGEITSDSTDRAQTLIENFNKFLEKNRDTIGSTVDEESAASKSLGCSAREATRVENVNKIARER